MPNTIRVINPDAFSYTSGISYINIPEGVQIIGERAFKANSLKSITIPKSVQSIERGAFLDCTSLTDVYYEGTQEEWSYVWIAEGNDALLNADIHYQYAGETYSKEEVDNITGDIEIALDSIISIQNELIGGDTV